MRNAVLLFSALCFLTSAAFSQDRVRERDLDGTWQLNFDVDYSDADGPFERIALKAVMGLLDEIDVRFDFRDDNNLRIMVDSFGDKEEEESDWFINKRGALVLGDTGPVEADSEETVWLMGEDHILWAYEADDDGQPVERKGMYLTRLGR